MLLESLTIPLRKERMEWRRKEKGKEEKQEIKLQDKNTGES